MLTTAARGTARALLYVNTPAGFNVTVVVEEVLRRLFNFTA
jgi:hypothetical protein